ncbi:hypothetical protein CXG81DRAFT_19514 [Caulochytrium protostelioides]|uniref:Uncharacterized protein n=1 Tax=Caulochytrium protostelioides TaxID=1555241 RepID=A0A4P9X6E0_9FUNG|nr:hypothetical protein CXG81DRAFT_19514 [Caulochytrium protostelioides]|eukprot:RKP00561.1 hypothetical protein CXG81DRAFT_19514 [Caulochytrium protostelioides]
MLRIDWEPRDVLPYANLDPVLVVGTCASATATYRWRRRCIALVAPYRRFAPQNTVTESGLAAASLPASLAAAGTMPWPSAALPPRRAPAADPAAAPRPRLPPPPAVDASSAGGSLLSLVVHHARRLGAASARPSEKDDAGGGAAPDGAVSRGACRSGAKLPGIGVRFAAAAGFHASGALMLDLRIGFRSSRWSDADVRDGAVCLASGIGWLNAAGVGFPQFARGHAVTSHFPLDPTTRVAANRDTVVQRQLDLSAWTAGLAVLTAEALSRLGQQTWVLTFYTRAPGADAVIVAQMEVTDTFVGLLQPAAPCMPTASTGPSPSSRAAATASAVSSPTTGTGSA